MFFWYLEIIHLVRVFTSAIKIFLAQEVPAFIKEPAPPATEDTSDRILTDMEASIQQMVKEDPRLLAPVKPFKVYLHAAMGEHGEDIEEHEVIMGLSIALGTLLEDLSSLAESSSDQSFHVEKTLEEGETVFDSYLQWRPDRYSPQVYAAVLGLFEDGFIYKAESNEYVIRSKVVR